METVRIARTAVDTALFHIDRPYDYHIPPGMNLEPGQRVIVPFGNGNRRTEAMVLAVVEESNAEKLKSVIELLDTEPVVDGNAIRLALWMNDRFYCTAYDAFRAMLPPDIGTSRGSKRASDKVERIAALAQPLEEVISYYDALPRSAAAQRGILKLLMSGSIPVAELLEYSGASAPTFRKLVNNGIAVIEEVERLVIPEPPVSVPEITLNAEQEAAYTGIVKLTERKNACCALLKGVTGSGKTLVYIKIIQRVIADGGQALVLVPEIALTPQLIAVFSDYFGERAFVLHSALGVSERREAWRSIRAGFADVVVGTRSAVFAPLERLGVIIIDEEQEYTYKSENSPRYHARDIAKFRCVQHGALLLLGSATPSLETAYCAAKGSYESFTLKERYNKKTLPLVEMADLRAELRKGNDSTISEPLAKEIAKNLEAGEQTILFLNRRGFHRVSLCSDCGETRQCQNCSVPLTYHAHNDRLLCHYCGFSAPREGRCSKCGGGLVFFGAGTQKVVEDLNVLFPGVEIMRMDTDTTGYKGAHKELLKKFSRSKVPVLVGTQMITKGLDIENVTLIGVVAADMMLYVDDYRANERAFALIAQVIGRAGRGGKPGRAVIQTMSPKHPVLLQAAMQDYDSFFESETQLRAAQGYPPFGEMIMLNLFSGDDEVLMRICAALRDEIDNAVKELGLEVRIFGPASARVAKINNRYRRHITLCGKADITTRRYVAALLRGFRTNPANKGVVIYADLHPNDF
ncbi:MAG: primosomal protein N' [Oscillospiraceae bacterium]|nr:primosomal protein N' [Oscillospiraceae bacterium]